MRKIFFIISICTIILLKSANAQSVGIGTNAPKASAVLDVTSTNKGILFPRMTTAQRNAITNPANNLHIFNTTISSLEYYDSTFNVWTPYCNYCSVFSDTIWNTTNSYLVPAGYNKVRIVINNLVNVFGTDLTPAISLVNVPAGGSVIIENFGGIYGKGGDGGKAGATSISNPNINCSPVNAQPGSAGKDAIHSVTGGIQLTIYNYGIIAGGGGGGGGGHYGSAAQSAGGGGGGGQGAPSVGGSKGILIIPAYTFPVGPWICREDTFGDYPTNATNGGNGSIAIRGDFGTGSTGTGGGSRGGYGGTLGTQGQTGFGNGGIGGVPGKAIRFNNGNNSITNIGAGVVYGQVD